MGFGDASHEQFMGNIMASVAAYQRDANKEQVVNRMRARLLNGFWPFPVPIGYNHVKGEGGGKVVVADGEVADLVRDTFEGFAAGRFSTIMDAVRFMAGDRRLPFDRKSCAHPQRVKDMFGRILYTGHIEYQPWDVPLRVGKHQAIVSMQTYEKVQVNWVERPMLRPVKTCMKIFHYGVFSFALHALSQ